MTQKSDVAYTAPCMFISTCVTSLSQYLGTVVNASRIYGLYSQLKKTRRKILRLPKAIQIAQLWYSTAMEHEALSWAIPTAYIESGRIIGTASELPFVEIEV